MRSPCSVAAVTPPPRPHHAHGNACLVSSYVARGTGSNRLIDARAGRNGSTLALLSIICVRARVDIVDNIDSTCSLARSRSELTKETVPDGNKRRILDYCITFNSSMFSKYHQGVKVLIGYLVLSNLAIHVHATHDFLAAADTIQTIHRQPRLKLSDRNRGRCITSTGDPIERNWLVG